MINRNVQQYIYHPKTPLRKAIQDLYQKKTDICLVCSKNILQGVVTLGDIKKAILEGHDPMSPITAIMNRDFTSSQEKDIKKLEELSLKENKFKTGRIIKIPLLDSNGKLKALYINKGLDKKYSHKKILVTGGAGYLGSILSRKLLDRGYEVIVLDKLSFGIEPIRDLLKKDLFSLIRGNIGNINDLISGIKGVDSVVHLAGIVGDPAASLNPTHTLEANYFSTKALIDLSKYFQVSRFIFASSCSVYGASPNILKEDSPLNPVSLYARSKIYSEKELTKATDDYFNPVILRFGTLYGLSPRMRFDLVVNKMAADAYFNKEITVNGGSQWRPLLYVADAAESCIKALEAPLEKVKGQIFNVGSENQNYKISEIAEIIRTHIPKVKINYSDEVGDRRDYRVSFDKIKDIKFTTKYDIKTAVKELAGQFNKKRFRNFTDSKFSNFLNLKLSLDIE